MEKWEIPAETAEELKKIDVACGDVLRRLGGLEADFMNNKQMLFEELAAVRGQFKATLDGAATKAGLDLKKERWALDLNAGTLQKAS